MESYQSGGESGRLNHRSRLNHVQQRVGTMICQYNSTGGKFRNKLATSVNRGPRTAARRGSRSVRIKVPEQAVALPENQSVRGEIRMNATCCSAESERLAEARRMPAGPARASIGAIFRPAPILSAGSCPEKPTAAMQLGAALPTDPPEEAKQSDHRPERDETCGRFGQSSEDRPWPVPRPRADANRVPLLARLPRPFRPFLPRARRLRGPRP